MLWCVFGFHSWVYEQIRTWTDGHEARPYVGITVVRLRYDERRYCRRCGLKQLWDVDKEKFR